MGIFNKIAMQLTAISCNANVSITGLNFSEQACFHKPDGFNQATFLNTHSLFFMLTQEKVMTTQEVADRFYALALEGKYDQIQSELYSQNVRSIEPPNAPWQTVQGLDKVMEKARQWQAMTEEMHDGYCNEPQVAGNYFCCLMGMDVTLKGQPRIKMDEIAVYEVKDGKIVTEQFFY
jgi:hypothetical protein